MSQYFPPYRSFKSSIKVELDLSNYTAKADLTNITHTDASRFATKVNLASLKAEVDKLDIDKLVPVSNDLAKLSNVVKNDVVKKTEYSKLVTKVNNIDSTDFVKKTKFEKEGSDFEDKISKIDKKIPDVRSLDKKTDYSSEITELENKIPNVSGFLLTSVFNSKITEVENIKPDIKNLASKKEVTAVENKMPDVSNLVTKSDYAAEITKIKNDYVTNTALDARHKDLVQKTTFESKLKKVDDKVCADSSKVLSYEHKLKQREDTINDPERDAFILEVKIILVMMVCKIILYFGQCNSILKK